MPEDGTVTLGHQSLLSNHFPKMALEVLLFGTDVLHRGDCRNFQLLALAMNFVMLSHVVTQGLRCSWGVNAHKEHAEDSAVQPGSRVTDLIRHLHITEWKTETPQKEKWFFF